jgi:hypothetical protein
MTTMNFRTILTICFLLLSLTLMECSNGKKQDAQPPAQADQERIEKEYQQNLEKLRELTSGTKETLDGKPVPKATKLPTPKPQPSPEK